MAAPPTDPNLGLVPAPATASGGEGSVVVPDGTPLVCAPELAPAARWWRRVIDEAFAVTLLPVQAPAQAPVRPPAQAPARLPAGGTAVVLDLDPALPVGGYRLETGGRTALVHAACADLAGAHAAAQTLRQLAGPQAFRRAASGAPLVLPVGTVQDAPRFPWRGVLLDVARHFLPKADVLRFVDLAAAHHLNVLQLHLTDDQGWRVEIERYPRLTEVGGWRRESTVGTWRTGTPDGQPHGGWYTKSDLREIVAYARERGVTVVPEIDVPGHVEAAVAAYPELGTRKVPHEVRTTWGVSTDVLDPSPEALAFFRDVLDEVCEVFDAPWVALGGDEVPTTLWRASPQVVARAARLGLVDDAGEPDVARLHGWFLARLAAHLRAHGRRAVVWDEAFGPDLPADAVVTCWRGWAVGARALAAGHDVVMAPEQSVYLDHRQSDHPGEPVPVGFVRTLEDVHGFEPFPAGMDVPDGPGRLLGVQAQVWTEHLDSARRVDYATFPRLAAFAEAAWTSTLPGRRGPCTPATTAFVERLRRDHLPRLDAAGVEHRPLDGPRPWQTRPGVAGHPRDLDAELAAGGWEGVGGWVEEPAPAGAPDDGKDGA
ncbi:N-acetyl-beta-hexosaminidase [Xylanimonas oleitrophica]|uniref:beta-N-acetylhexosaminidase n=1 Tax=Xylanimonas oleitrophica TaxID=2607479 RepID=A0A2W5WWW5_9MICO|nr:beta-N-acetylhexosaminidase [Xylanimonas oleitrophica]PZR55142.1 N-acetyl-beta-hexosaminidase [Xylanimonas oleitrophica]